MPYRQCQYIISLEDKDSTEQTKSDDLRYTGLHLMEALNLSLTCDFTNTAGYVICISLFYKIAVSYTVKCVSEASNRIIYSPI